MASALSSELSCPICLELFDDPVTLPCMHSYCRKCLESILLSDGGRHVQCPECRNVTSLDEAGLQKLPRNFTLTNIVAKYRSVDKIPQIPCDLCEVKSQQNAVKSCRECKLSYCMHCLILHPLRGVFTEHSLVEPQEFESHVKKSVCLKCSKLSEKDDKLENCQRDHRNDVMDVETAKLKLKSQMQGNYVTLDERRRKYLQDIYKTTETLNDIMKNADTKRTELKQKYHGKTEEILSNFETDFKRMQDDYDSGIKEVEVKGQGHLLQLNDASSHLHDILPDMKEMLEKAEKDLDFKELQELFARVQKEVEERNIPDCLLVPPCLDVEKKVDEIFIKESKAEDSAKSTGLDELASKRDIPKVTIGKCAHNPRKKEEGASVTVSWEYDESHTKERKFEMKFVEIADKGKDPARIIIVRNIGIPSYSFHLSCTVNQLQANVTYSITVSVQDKPETESESTVVQTLPGVQCEPFSLCSIRKSKNTRLDWNHKRLTSDLDRADNSNQLEKAVGVTAGTIILNVSVYWEVEVSYHIRGVPNNNYAACLGICAYGNLDDVPNIVQNCFFYGISLGKGEKGEPVLLTYVEGKRWNTYILKGERLFTKKFGFFYNASQHYLVIINAQTNSLLLMAMQSKMSGLSDKHEYCPVFRVNQAGEPSIAIITGADITEIPSRLKEFLY